VTRGGARPALAALAAVTLVALVVRAAALGRLSLWIDEGYSVLQVTYRPFSDWTVDVHPPLYYALLLAWSRASTSDVWLRLLSALLGTATIPAVYALGARLAGRAVGLWAAAFTAVTWFHVWHSREARMYPLLVLAFAVALWGIVAGARDGRAAGWAAYALAGAVMAWSHGVGLYYALILAGLALVVPREDGRRWSWRPWLIATAAMLLAYVPWLPVAFQTTRRIVDRYWIPPAAGDPPVFTTIHYFTVAPILGPGRILRGQLGVDVGALLGPWLWLVPILAVLALACVAARPQERWMVRVLVLAFLAPIGLFTAMSLMVRPILLPRILLPVVVPLVLLLALGVEALPRRWARAGAGTLVALILLLGTFYGIRHNAGQSEAWREASRYVQEVARPGDALLVLSSRLQGDPRASARARALSTGESLMLRYDDSGRLRAMPRVTTQRLMDDCRGEVAACLDAALRTASATGDVWVVRRPGPVPPELEAWVAQGPGAGEGAGQGTGMPREFRSLLVERRRLR